MKYKKETVRKSLASLTGKRQANKTAESYVPQMLSVEKFDAIESVECNCGTFVSKYRLRKGLTRCSRCERRCINE